MVVEPSIHAIDRDTLNASLIYNIISGMSATVCLMFSYKKHISYKSLGNLTHYYFVWFLYE